jgi:hypothetical protein
MLEKHQKFSEAFLSTQSTKAFFSAEKLVKKERAEA